MESLFDKNTYEKVLGRIAKLTPSAEKHWGKMDVAQMLAHCEKAFQVPLSDKAFPRKIIGILIGWMFKEKLYNDSLWKKNLPTSPKFLIKTEKNFEVEKKALISSINRFHTLDKENVGLHPHPMFGKFTPDQWGMSMYKHLDHHLRQFGV